MITAVDAGVKVMHAEPDICEVRPTLLAHRRGKRHGVSLEGLIEEAVLNNT